MAAYYVDSSVLAKVYHTESGTARFDTLLADRGHLFHISSLCVVEVHSTSVRKVREGTLTPAGFDAVVGRLRHHVGTGLFRLHPIEGTSFDRATELLRTVGARWPLRSLDAIHLAAALDIRGATPDLVFVTSDARLATAAADVGFPVLDPTTTA